jgi:hypothetical protein
MNSHKLHHCLPVLSCQFLAQTFLEHVHEEEHVMLPALHAETTAACMPTPQTVHVFTIYQVSFVRTHLQTFLEHIHEEEHVMLPALREELEEAQLRDLGKRFEAAKQHMPTR